MTQRRLVYRGKEEKASGQEERGPKAEAAASKRPGMPPMKSDPSEKTNNNADGYPPVSISMACTL